MVPCSVGAARRRRGGGAKQNAQTQRRQQLSGELDKMREGETSLLKGADALIADVEAAHVIS